jgi:acetyltransferase
LEECGQKGVRWAIIETAGFREYGEEGLRLEGRIVEVAHQYGIRFLGPNCVGVMNLDNGFSVPFLRVNKPSKAGEVSLVSQSGGVGFSVLNLMGNEGISMNKFVSVGNMLDITAEDVLEFLLDDAGTKVIFLYLESLRDGRQLMDIACRSTKPILVFKSNIGSMGKVIAASHTAALSSDDRVAEAAFKQADIVRVHDATSLLNNLKALRLPMRQGGYHFPLRRGTRGGRLGELSGLELAQLPRLPGEIEKHFPLLGDQADQSGGSGDLSIWTCLPRSGNPAAGNGW